MNRLPTTLRTSVFAALATMALAGCGDPIVVLGDTPGQVRLVAGLPDSIGTTVDSLALRTRFTLLSSVAFDDSSSLLYVADRGATRQNNGVTTQVARLFTVNSRGRIQHAMDGGNCAAGPFCVVDPVNMISAGRSLIIADALGNRVVRFDKILRTAESIAGTGDNVPATQGLPAASSPISRPSGVAAGADGLYVSERGADRVWRIGADGTLSLIAGGGAEEITASPIPGANARLREPSGLALGDGTLYIANSAANAIEAVDLATGTIRRLAGDGVPGFGGDGGPALSARLLAPRDVSIDARGVLLFIADLGNNRVRSINLSSGIIQTFVGTGSAIYNGNRLAAGETAIKAPVDLAGSSRPFLYIVDQGHVVVRRAALGF